MNVLAWLVFGSLIGIFTYILDPGASRDGIWGSILVGIAGSLLGGFLGSLILNVSITGFNLSSFLVAMAGSLLLLYIQGAVIKR